MRRNRSEIQVFSLSFLDVLSCALGAVLIVLVVVPTFAQLVGELGADVLGLEQHLAAGLDQLLDASQQALGFGDVFDHIPDRDQVKGLLRPAPGVDGFVQEAVEDPVCSERTDGLLRDGLR